MTAGMEYLAAIDKAGGEEINDNLNPKHLVFMLDVGQ